MIGGMDATTPRSGGPGSGTSGDGPTTCSFTPSCRGGATACRWASTSTRPRPAISTASTARSIATSRRASRSVDLERLTAELDAVLQAAADGTLYLTPPFDALPPDRREVRDIAFSGDGEPTTYCEVRGGRGDRGRRPPPVRSRGHEDRPHHRRGVPGEARGARGTRGDGREQRRDLGEARRRNRGLLHA